MFADAADEGMAFTRFNDQESCGTFLLLAESCDNSLMCGILMSGILMCGIRILFNHSIARTWAA